MTKSWGIALAAFFLLTLFVGQTNAALIVYSGSDAAGSADPRPNADAAAAAYSSAAAALGPTSLIDFESAPVGSFHNYGVAPGVSINGIDSFSSDQTIANAPFSTPDELFGYNTTLGGTQFALVDGGNLVFSFSPAIQSFGAYLSGIQNSIETITFSDGSPQTVAIPLPSPTNGGVAFVGFTDAGMQISSVTINVLGDIVALDDVVFGTAAAVPEPAALTLFATAIAALAGFRLLPAARQHVSPPPRRPPRAAASRSSAAVKSAARARPWSG